MAPTDRIELRGLVLSAICGALPEERERAQPLEIDLDVVADLSVAGASDELADTLDYGAITADVERVVTTARADRCSSASPRPSPTSCSPTTASSSVTVTVRKLRPPVPQVTRHLGRPHHPGALSDPSASSASAPTWATRWAILREAVGSLTGVVAVSPVYQTDPVGGPAGQGPFLNLVVELDTDLSARELLGVCHRLESAADRVRTERWGPRTLDVDIVWIDGVTVDEPDLQVPHPRMRERRFVLAPARRPRPRRGRPRLGATGPRAAVEPRRPARLPAGDDRHRPALAARHRAGPGRLGARRPPWPRSGWPVARARCAAATTCSGAAAGVDLLVIATPDAAIAEVAAAVEPVADHVVAHLAGSLGLDVLAPHPRRAACTRSSSLPDAEVGARRLRAGRLVRGGRRPAEALALVEAWSPTSAAVRSPSPTPTGRRYHAAAAIASNHLVALLGQVERVAGGVGRAARGLPRPGAGHPRQRRRARPRRRPHRPGGPRRLGHRRPPPRRHSGRRARRLRRHGRGRPPPGRRCDAPPAPGADGTDGEGGRDGRS